MANSQCFFKEALFIVNRKNGLSCVSSQKLNQGRLGYAFLGKLSSFKDFGSQKYRITKIPKTKVLPPKTPLVTTKTPFSETRQKKSIHKIGSSTTQKYFRMAKVSVS